jgi:translation elongation factor EF-Tu-like GTPase
MTIEDVFQIEGRGTIVTGLRGSHSALAQRGVFIELHTPKDVGFSNSIAEVELFLRGRLSQEPPKMLGLLLASPIPSEDLPRGTRVHYADPPEVA